MADHTVTLYPPPGGGDEPIIVREDKAAHLIKKGWSKRKPARKKGE